MPLYTGQSGKLLVLQGLAAPVIVKALRCFFPLLWSQNSYGYCPTMQHSLWVGRKDPDINPLLLQRTYKRVRTYVRTYMHTDICLYPGMCLFKYRHIAIYSHWFLWAILCKRCGSLVMKCDFHGIWPLSSMCLWPAWSVYQLTITSSFTKFQKKMLQTSK